MKRVYPITIQSGLSQSGSYLLMLCEPESKMQIPIIIGPHEAQAILLAKDNVKARRPMTHDLMLSILDSYGLLLREVTIDRVEDGIFYATLHVSDGFSMGVGGSAAEHTFDSRTTDAITLALLAGAPIMVEESVLEETAVHLDADLQAAPVAQSIEQLEAELRRCEDNEDYERAAEIMAQIEQMKKDL